VKSNILDHFTLHDLAQLRCSGAIGPMVLIAQHWSLLLGRPVSVDQVQDILGFFSRERDDAWTTLLYIDTPTPIPAKVK